MSSKMFSLHSVRTSDICKWCVICIVGFSLIDCLQGESSPPADLPKDLFHEYETEDAFVIEEEKRLETVEEAKRYRLDILGVSSTKNRGVETVDLPEEGKLFCSEVNPPIVPQAIGVCEYPHKLQADGQGDLIDPVGRKNGLKLLLKKSVIPVERFSRSLEQNFTSPRRAKRQIAWQSLLSGPCITSQGKLGRCTSFRACYPYFKLPNLNNWESWVLGVYDTCSYFTESGEQAFGVCCTNPNAGRPIKPPQTTTGATTTTITTTTTTQRPVDPSTFNPIPPNWPPPIPPVPTHPPDHTIPPIPTHPPSHTPPTHPTPPSRPTQPTWPTFPTIPPKPTFPTQKPTFPTQKPTFPTLRPTQKPTIPTRPTTQRPTVPTAPPLPTRPTTKWPPTHPPIKPIGPPAPPDNEIFDGSCGVKNGYQDQDQERIVGGQTADVNEWPWVAALFNSGRQFCGGSLIDHEHILSAAHCVAHMSSWDVARMTVRLGDHNIRISTETRHIEKRVKRVVRHRGFDPRTLYNDVAVLTLDSPVSFSRTIRPICLPQGNQLYAGMPATVIGWGSLRESGAQPAELQEVNIPIWTNQDCRLKYGPAAPGGIVEHFLCAGQPSRDSCSGDSGGPLMVNQGKWTQVGIVSWGIGCGKGQYPGVYTRVTHFMMWIMKNLK